MSKFFNSMAALKSAIQKEVNAAKTLIKLYREYRVEQRARFRFGNRISVRED